jgi:hypothetical protein
VTVLLAASLSAFTVAKAEDGCGFGCRNAPYGGCVVIGWAGGLAGSHVRNECPAGNRPRRPCPRDYVWKFGTCFQS